MPKERLHILLADESLSLLRDLRPCSDLDREAYLLGAICPDLFFYDLPSFNLGRVGRRLHRLEGEAAVDFFVAWMQEQEGALEPFIKSWMLGFVGHLLADGLLHPSINGFCRLFSEDLKLNASSCHHWLESELESHWLATIGPADGYLPLLKRFGRQNGKIAKCLDCFRAFLMRMEATEIPSAHDIHRCLVLQTRLLRIFAASIWEKPRAWLLRSGFGAPMGALLVPPKAAFCLQMNELSRGSMKTPRLGEMQELCRSDWMAWTISRLTTRLLELLRYS
jgi:hypothetical protein